MADTEQLYVRFGRPPETGASRNWLEDSEEIGISCFRAWKLSPSHYLIETKRAALAGAVATYVSENRPMYGLSGVELQDRGASGDVLLDGGTVESWRITDRRIRLDLTQHENIALRNLNTYSQHADERRRRPGSLDHGKAPQQVHHLCGQPAVRRQRPGGGVSEDARLKARGKKSKKKRSKR